MPVSKEAIDRMVGAVGGRVVPTSARVTNIYGGGEGEKRVYVTLTQETPVVQVLTVDVYEQGRHVTGGRLVEPTLVREGLSNEVQEGGLMFRDVVGEELIINPGAEVVIHHAPQQSPGQRVA